MWTDCLCHISLKNEGGHVAGEYLGGIDGTAAGSLLSQVNARSDNHVPLELLEAVVAFAPPPSYFVQGVVSTSCWICS